MANPDSNLGRRARTLGRVTVRLFEVADTDYQLIIRSLVIHGRPLLQPNIFLRLVELLVWRGAVPQW